ncbi:hypothetical protein TI39_contig264g00001 [Zymoseptoria brevis]|uniref:Uncharacterized protein n=1 Tax=Zymoseptoria brevis TaxID=1047168 RepID=A0A0F4GYB6_9PEZI|nr:hypothetical protein TI39_contig264g00001 [Zymoseptoria brevis]
MPPIRTMPAIKPVRTERTHEENQERAYIAASRRSDRSLEARVESARRASEIHKKRTGRSLRVREEDVLNEEMYEEEDDDLPMQFRRINALYPGQAYNAFTERVNNYLAGQVGVRNYLHQAIYQANQHAMNNQFLNPAMQQNGMNGGQQQWQPNMQNDGTRADSPQDQTQQAANTQMQNNAQRMSLSMPAPKSRSSSSGQSPTTQKASPTSSRPSIDNSNPLTTTLPIETQQLLDGSSYANQVYPSQFTPGVPMPSTYSYTYNPNSKANNNPGSEQFAFTNKGLNQTLSPHAMHHQPTTPYSDSHSASDAAPSLDFGFGDDMFNDSSYAFDMDFNSGGQHNGPGNLSGTVTPGGDWDSNHDDFFNYAAASD